MYLRTVEKSTVKSRMNSNSGLLYYMSVYFMCIDTFCPLTWSIGFRLRAQTNLEIFPVIHFPLHWLEYPWDCLDGVSSRRWVTEDQGHEGHHHFLPPAGVSLRATPASGSAQRRSHISCSGNACSPCCCRKPNENSEC